MARSDGPEVGNDHLKPANHSNNAGCCIEKLQEENSFVFSKVCPDTNQGSRCQKQAKSNELSSDVGSN